MEINNQYFQDHRIEAWMYRVPNEYTALLVSIMLATILSALLSSLSLTLFIVILVGTIIFVQLHQAQYLGNAVRIHKSQFPEIYEIFERYFQKLDIKNAALYISQDPYLNAYTIGLNRCTVVLTSALVEQLTREELNFVIGHELGHFKAGHTVISTLTNPLGVGNIIVNFVFAFWSRKAEYSADRCGLILTKDIDSAISSFLKLSVGGNLYESLNIKGYIAQIKEADSDAVGLSELLVDHPLTTNRIKNLLLFWRQNFVLLKGSN